MRVFVLALIVLARTFLTFSRDATALVWTVFFATVVLETTRTPVKEEVAKDMTMLLDFVDVCEDAPDATTRAGSVPPDRAKPCVHVIIYIHGFFMRKVLY